MAILKTYSITSDITAQTIESDRLYDEIVIDNSITGFEGITRLGDNFNIHGTSINNESSLDAVILNHSGIAYSEDLTLNELTSNEDNLNPQGWGFAKTVYLNSNNSSRKIYGLEKGYIGEEKTLVNNGNKYITLVHNSSRANSLNHIMCGGKKSLKFPPQGVLKIQYFSDNCWRIINKSW
jgi:hypothetical protein